MVDSAELFEAISHPMRIKILKILEKKPSSFASLKRQLDIDSSGNLDHHLKKLAELVAVREDGLYGLTNAGKEALLSIEAVETWVETEKRKRKKFAEMPKVAVSLALLEIFTTVSIFWFFLVLIQLPLSKDSLWGFLFFGALLLTGFCSGFGIFFCWRWSWIFALAKSTLIMSMSLFLLIYLWNPQAVVQSSSVALCYLAFVGAEIAIVVTALTHPLMDFLGINRLKLPYHVIVSGLLCMSSGLMLIILESWLYFPVTNDPGRNWPVTSGPASTVFISVIDTSILCGLLIIVGGVLILLRNNTLGAALSIIFGFFPPPLSPQSIPSLLPQQSTYHVFDIISKMSLPQYFFVVAVIVGSLPVVGGLLALASARRIRK